MQHKFFASCEQADAVIRIRSGAQTGVDRGALDGALSLGQKVCGWIPKNRLARTPIPTTYDSMLVEMTDEQFPRLIGADEEEIYCARTEQNAKDGDGTLVIMQHESEYCGGTSYTAEMAAKHNKPCFVLDLSKQSSLDAVVTWIKENNIFDLNVGGPNETKSPGAHLAAYNVVRGLLLHPGLNEKNEKRICNTPTI